MKKILFLLMIAFPGLLSAQRYQDPLLYGERKNRLRSDSVLQLPIGLTGSNSGKRTSLSLPPITYGYDTGQIRYNVVDSSIKYHTGFQWLSLTGGGINNSNTGSGYRLLKPSSQEIKSLFAGYGALFDSTSNADGITLILDTVILSGKYARTNGTNATGTWGIDITGNAATVTNGVYTTGSYANPSWITSLAWTKITGTPTTLAGYGITDALSTTLADGRFLVGNVSNVATAVLPTGDVTFSNAGVFTIGALKVATGMIQANAVTFAKFVQGAANTVVTNPTAALANFTTTALSANTLLGMGSTGNIAAITVSGILSFSGAVLSAIEVDGSVSNELQTFASTSDATTHTVTLSNSGGSFQLVEGSNITLTTSGTGLNGIITIASTGGGGGYNLLQEEGTGITARTTLNFIGAGFTVADNAGLTKSEVTLHQAGASQEGVVSTGLQTFAGNKTFTGYVTSPRTGGGASGNEAFGFNSLQSVGIGNNNNTAFGYEAGYLNTGSNNVFIGYRAGRESTQSNDVNIGYNNTYGGGGFNIMIGQEIGLGYGLGNNNVLMGFRAARENVSSTSVIIGYEAGAFASGATTSGNVFLGYRAGYNETGSNKLYIANSSTSNPLVYGDFGSNYVSIEKNLGVDIKNPAHPFHAAPVQYAVGTASQATTTITGVGTTWTSAMVGSYFVFTDGTRRTITAFVSATSLTVAETGTVASQAYEINYPGVAVTSIGEVQIGSITDQGDFTLQNTGGTYLDATGKTIVFKLGSDATGDVFYRNASGFFTRLGIGAAGNVLTVSGGLPVWSAPGGGSSHAMLSATHTDATIGTVARGDLITGQTATPAWTRLAKGTINQIFQSDGTDIGWVSMSGDATLSAGAITIGTDVVTFAKMQNISTQTFIGRNTAATGDPEELSIATAKTMLGLTGTNSGDQSLANTSDATSHTVTLTGGTSVQFIEGTNITLTTGGTGGVGTVTIASTGSGYTNLTQFVDQTAWRIFYSNSLGDVVELALGASGTYLQSNGAAAAPTWVTPGGSGDMILASAQTNSGIKTFLDGTMKLRNVANTFDGYFVNTNTSDRIYTLQNAAGTLAFLSDITGINSGTNTGDQSLANTSDATSHTVTLTGGTSVQLIEGTNITLTTGGTGGVGTVTIAAPTRGIDDVLAVNQTLTASRTINGGGNQLIISNTITPAVFEVNTAITNATQEMAVFSHKTSGVAANSFGGYIAVQLETSTGTFNEASKEIFKWTDATTATRTSEYSLQLSSSATLQDVMAIGGAGQLRLHKYGVNTFTGTAAYWLAVTATGQLIEMAAPGGGGLGDPGANGVVVRTALNTTINRTLTGTTNRITITNGDGVSGNPTFDIGTDVVTLTGSQTLTNKTLTAPVISSITNTGTLTLPTVTSTVVSYKTASEASNATPTPSGDAKENEHYITAQAATATFGAPSGTATNGNYIIIRIKDNATAQLLGWNAIYRAGTNLALPTTTTISKTMYIKFIYNSTDTKWDLISVLDGLSFSWLTYLLSLLFGLFATKVEAKIIEMKKSKRRIAA